VAAACVAGAAHASHDIVPLAPAPVTAGAADLVDVPFFDSTRTAWGGLRASAATASYVARESDPANGNGLAGAGVAGFGACTAYRVLCDAARDAVERQYAARFEYGLASPLPSIVAPATVEDRPVDLASAEPFMFAQPDDGTRIGAITDSLRASLARADLPAGVPAQITRMLAERVDPKQRGWTGDYFRVAFEADDTGAHPRGPRVTALEIRFRGQDIVGVWFAADARSRGDYYDLDGVPLAGSRFAMPVAAKRISSHFGARVHPVTGVRHGHSGVDLAAPAGRAVHASERGTVSFIGTEPNGYGKYVVVRHDGGYASYYAHLSAFEPSLRVGTRVARGHRVGEVGSTGTATGPHLHFEVRRHNRPVDPVALLHSASAAKLKGERRVAFDRVASEARTRLAAASWSPHLAASGFGAPSAG